ncbi:MAG: PIN domain-containing protein [Gemmatimonadetes bacterium]|nr:PIN domain-containing protein [Gemmatimonadota bacterium]
MSKRREKLLGKFRLSDSLAEQAIHTLCDGMEIVEPVPLREPVSRDPDDDVVLASALSGGCVAIVTGDRDLLDLRSWSGIAILSPREFWDAFGPTDDH